MSSLPSPAPRVLIADDDEGIRQALRDLLGEEGMDVVGEASDGMGAVAAAKELDPDVVLMDLRMPDLGGAEATTMIRTARPNTQVIILSAYDDPALNRSAKEAGAYAYLVKGCSAALVRDVLLEAFKLKQGLERRTAQS
jgi:DNA-binding NarL/FixJ family response regulator